MKKRRFSWGYSPSESKNCMGVISKYSQIFKNCAMEGRALPEVMPCI